MSDLPFERTVPKADPQTPVLDGAGTLLDFWQWAFSDLVANDVRGAFAEFIVGSALGVLDEQRGLWTAWNLTYGPTKIEVKATGDVQAWAPTGRPPRPAWGIGARYGWDPATNTYAATPIRSADVYVLCHWKGTSHEPLSPAHLEAWDFYVLPTQALDERHPDRKVLSMTQLIRLVDDKAALRTNYARLQETVDVVVGWLGGNPRAFAPVPPDARPEVVPTESSGRSALNKLAANDLEELAQAPVDALGAPPWPDPDGTPTGA